MGLPWKRDEDLNIASNEYTTKLSINRCFTRLLDNDKYLDEFLEAGINRATGLRFATDQQIKDLDAVSGAISPGLALALSATYSETLTGVSGGVDRFITPETLNGVFDKNELLPKVTFIDITYKGKMYSFSQIVDAAKEEINNFVLSEGTTIYVRFIWHNLTDETIDISRLATLIVIPSLYSGQLQGNKDRIMTLTINNEGDWRFIRERTTYELASREKSDGYKSLF